MFRKTHGKERPPFQAGLSSRLTVSSDLAFLAKALFSGAFRQPRFSLRGSLPQTFRINWIKRRYRAIRWQRARFLKDSPCRWRIATPFAASARYHPLHQGAGKEVPRAWERARYVHDAGGENPPIASSGCPAIGSFAPDCPEGSMLVVVMVLADGADLSLYEMTADELRTFSMRRALGSTRWRATASSKHARRAAC